MTSSSVHTAGVPRQASPLTTEPKYILWANLAGLTVLYALLVSREISRPLWYDELMTYYIAKAPTWANFFDLLRRWDLNPPTLHALSRLSMRLFGENAIAVRMPSVIEFYIASVILFFYSRRKLGSSYAAIPVLLLWASIFFRYATEARPYALLLVCFSALLLCWELAITSVPRKVPLAGVALANLGLIASHVFAPLSLLPFFVAEIARFVKRGKTDYPLWAALSLPLFGVFAYIPLFYRYGWIIYPARFQASIRKIAAFYWHTCLAIPLILLLAAGAVWFLQRKKSSTTQFNFSVVDAALYATLLANPILLNLVLMQGHGAFWDRYCITTAAAVFVLFGVLISAILHGKTQSAYFVTLVLAAAIAMQKLALPAYNNLINGHSPENATAIERVEPGLPLVAASGLTFVEMSHNESLPIVSRLYYLQNLPAAIRYAHANLFEHLDEMVKDFGLRGTVEQYSDFVRRHPKFLVLGTPNYPEDWLLRKLAADGARIALLGIYRIPYKDTSLFEVSVDGHLRMKPRE